MRRSRQVSRCLRSTRAALACALVVFAACHAPAHAQRVGSAVDPSAPDESCGRAERAEARLLADPRLASDRPAGRGGGRPAVDHGERRRLAASGRCASPLLSDEFYGDLSPQLDWEEMGDGSIVSSVTVTSPGASAMRMAVQAELPDAGELRFFGAQSEPGVRRFGLSRFRRDGFPPGERRAGDARGGRRRSRHRRERERALRPVVFRERRRPRDPVVADRAGRHHRGGDLPAVPRPHCPRSRSASRRSPISTDRSRRVQFTINRLNCMNHVDVQCAEGLFPETHADAVASILYEMEDGTYLCSGDPAERHPRRHLHPLLSDRPPLRAVRDGCAHRGSVVVLSARNVRPCRDRRTVRSDLRRSGPAGDAPRTGLEPAAPQGPVACRSHVCRLERRSRAPPGRGTRPPPSARRRDEVFRRTDAGPERRSGQGAWARWSTRSSCASAWVRPNPAAAGRGLFDGEHFIGALSGATTACENGTSVYGSLRDFFPQVRRWLDPVWSHGPPVRYRGFQP